MSDDLENAELEHIAPLGDDKIPDSNQAHMCFSCDAPFTGVYCASCGQKNDDYRRSIFRLGAEVFASLTALESRIWQTWMNLLFCPGKVPREFANGARTKWSSPVRVYIAMSILLFGFLNISQMQLISIDLDVKPIEGVTKIESELTAEDLKITPAIHFFETRKRIDTRNASRNFDLIAVKIEGDEGIKLDIGTPEDKAAIENLREQLESDGVLSEENQAQIDSAIERFQGAANGTTSQDDTENRSGSELEHETDGFTFSGIDGKKYRVDDWSSVLFTLIKDPAKLNAAFYKYLPRIMFFMMPLTMIIGAIFIRGRGNAMLYDHLVHAAYIHAVAFFLLFVGLMVSLFYPSTPIPMILLVIILIYLPLSLKRMFNRGWFKTIWTSYGVGLIYTFIMLIIMFGLLGLQLVNTVTEIGTPISP